MHPVREEKLLADTLVPLVVLEVALGTAAPVAPNNVLTTMLAAVVALALIHI
jgi:hypothetical protein